MVDDDLARRPVRDQFPELAARPLVTRTHAGTDNALFRLGPDRGARLPRTASVSLQCEKEHRWLSAIAGAVPTPIPSTRYRGAPSGASPSPWSIARWFGGEAP